MASLQDQLLKAGLVDKNTAKKVHKEKHKQVKVARKSNRPEVDQTKLSAEQLQTKQVERDRALNRRHQEQAQIKSVQAQIAQLIALNKVDRTDGEIGYSFVHQKVVKKIYLNALQKNHLAQGRLEIVCIEKKQQSDYELVPFQVAEKIAARDPLRLVQINRQQDTETPPAEDDPYADFQVPDDLSW